MGFRGQLFVKWSLASLRRRPDFQAALAGWVLARALTVLAFGVAFVVADELKGEPTLQLHQGLFAWDGAFYRDIADYGYGALPQAALRFFPLLPMGARLLSIFFAGNVGIASIVIVNAASFAVGVAIYRLVIAEGGDVSVGKRSAMMIALMPPATVLVLGYAESLMMVLTIGAFLRFRKGKWGSAAVLGVLAGLSRPLGAAVALPMAIEAARGWSCATTRERAVRLLAVCSPLAAMASYLAWVQMRFGDWRLPLHTQTTADLRGNFVNPIAKIVDAVADLFGSERMGEGLHAPWILFYFVILIIVFRRFPISYGVYAGAIVVFALSAESLGSFERYGFSAFPLTLALSKLLDHDEVERWSLIVMGSVMTTFAVLVLTGSFVP